MSAEHSVIVLGAAHILTATNAVQAMDAELLLHRSCVKCETRHTLHVCIACTAEQACA